MRIRPPGEPGCHAGPPSVRTRPPCGPNRRADMPPHAGQPAMQARPPYRPDRQADPPGPPAVQARPPNRPPAMQARSPNRPPRHGGSPAVRTPTAVRTRPPCEPPPPCWPARSAGPLALLTRPPCGPAHTVQTVLFGFGCSDYKAEIGWDVAEWLERLTANAEVTTILGSILASSDTVESEGQQIKPC